MYGKLVDARLSTNNNGKTTVTLDFEKKTGYLVFISELIVNVCESLDIESFAVINKESAQVDLKISKGKTIEIETKSLKVIVGDNFKVYFYTLDGREICAEYEQDLVKDKDFDMSLAALEGHTVSEKNEKFNTIIKKKIHKDEAFFGLGDKTGFINKRCYEYEMWNTDDPSTHTEFYKALYKSIPFFIGIHSGLSYGLFYDDTYKSFFDMGKKSDEYFSISSIDGRLNYYFIYGKDIPAILEGYTYLTGTHPLPQIWTLGNQQSRWSYHNESEVRRIANGYRDNNLPLDVIHLDIDYMDNYKIFTTSPTNFPKMKELVDELKEMNIKIVPILDPGTKVEKAYDIYEEGIEKGYFAFDKNGSVYENAVWPGASVYPNFMLSDGRRWWSQNIKKLVDLGFRGIWTDMNEPASFNGPLPDDVIFPGEKRDYLHKEIHNIYGHMMANATYNGLLTHDRKRPFVITRAAYSGSQRYSTAWTGDNQSIWAHLQLSIPQLSNLGMSGFAFVGTDIGGFGSDTTKELLVRWLEANIFAPLLRNHSSMGTKDQEPWEFDKECLDIYRKYLDLRYEFIPYIYNLLYLHTKTGAPVMRPLVFHYQSDILTHNINDEYLVGENLLVSPILDQGKTKKLVYLPEGKWINYWTKEVYRGKYHYIVDAPLDVLPIFVKYNSMLVKHVLNDHIDPSYKSRLILEIYGEEALYSHYIDDGESFDYLNGVYQIYNFKFQNNELEIELLNDYPNNYDEIEIRVNGKVQVVSGQKNQKVNI